MAGQLRPKFIEKIQGKKGALTAGEAASPMAAATKMSRVPSTYYQVVSGWENERGTVEQSVRRLRLLKQSLLKKP